VGWQPDTAVRSFRHGNAALFRICSVLAVRIKPTKDEAYTWLLRGAAAADDALGAALFRCPRGAEPSLILEAHHDLPAAMVAFVRTLKPGDGTATGDAAAYHHRVVIRDAASDYLGTVKKASLDAGIHAATAMPVNDTSGRGVGVLTLYYDRPHHPTLAALRRLDAYREIAGRLLELYELESAVVGADTAAELSPAGHKAMAAVGKALPVCASTGPDCVRGDLFRHLDLVIDELARRGGTDARA
jgi:hypothetical protein